MKKPKEEIHPVYFIYGPESYLIDQEVQSLLQQTLTPKEKGLSFHMFNGKEHRGQEIVQSAQTLPMFSKYRFILVKEADQFNEEDMEVLLNYIQNPSPTTCLVLTGQTLGPWKNHRETIEKVGKWVECARLKGEPLISWIRKRAEEKGRTLTQDTVNYLVEVVGDSLYDLENILERVSLGPVGEKAIRMSEVEGVVSGVKYSTIFDLTDAIGQRDLKKAIGILERTIETKTIPFKKDEQGVKMAQIIPFLLSLIAKHYWRLWVVKQMGPHLRDVGNLAKELDLLPWVVKRLVEQGKNFSEASLREGIKKCYQTDLAIKRTHGPEELLIEKLVIDLYGREPTQNFPCEIE
ncbi:MAG: DNA polymerase III subunit delta [Thermodesulfobacteriota bacterium]